MNTENVLIVDDSKDSLNILGATLNSLKYFNLFRAEDGEAALKQYETKDIDICFLDLEMPSLNGIETLKKIKEINSDAYVIIVTGSCDAKDVQSAIKNGASGYIVKPFAQSRIEEVLTKYGNQTSTAAAG